MPDVDPKLIAANTEFGFRLFAQLLQHQNENVLISPSSVAIALSMTYNGASGNTQKAIASTLGVQGMSLEQINRANAALESSLENADPEVKLAIANSLWGRTGFSFKPDFLQRNRTFYNAEIASLDFSSPGAVDRINAWVSQNTAGKIPTIVDQISAAHVLFLINAVYFKGRWTEPFNKQDTRNRPFHLSNGDRKQQPMMVQHGEYRYAETDRFQAISLPYGNGRLSLYVFLPNSNVGLQRFNQTLTPENWHTWMGLFSKQEGTIQLPRFKFEYSTSLNQALKALGMTIAFDPTQADFSGISTEATAIDQVQHKTFMEVNEEGTEAAAVTSVAMMRASMQQSQPFQMVVDRPFFCVIRDNQTGTILFMGTVINPK
jgi:serine protease inhibitor